MTQKCDTLSVLRDDGIDAFMVKSKIHKLILKKDRFDMVSADTDFYKFVDDTRLYYTFERLICEEDRKLFVDNVAGGVESWFVVHMNALDGTLVSCYMSVKEVSGTDNIEVTILDIDMLVKSEKALDRKNRISDSIINLYGDDIFIYYPDRDEVEFFEGYSMDKSGKKMSLDELQGILEEIATDKSAVSGFVSGLRNGGRYLYIKTEGSIKNRESDIKHSIIKCAGLYEDGAYIMSVGYVHEYMERSYSDERKIEIDSLTGLIAKGEATNMAIKTIDVDKRENVSLAIVDIDHFKYVNDTFGHMVGDNVIKQVANIIAEEVGNDGFVGRIGGDEFLIMFFDAYDLENARARIRSIKNTVSARYPADVEGQPVITLSIGCAAYPKDAGNYEELFGLADFALYRAKEKGRNRYIIYDVEKHGTLAEIKKTVHLATRINNRGDMTLGDIMCVIMDKAFGTEEYPVERLLDDYVENFEVQRITLYDANEGKVLHMVGERVASNEVITETEKYIHSGYWQKCYRNTETIINDITTIGAADEKVYELMKKQGILSCIHIKFKDKNGYRYILSLESVSKRITWNTEHIHYFRLMAKVLSEYKLR